MKSINTLKDTFRKKLELAGIDKNNQTKMDKIQEILNGYWEE